jgi:hypothetical protein
LTQNQWYFHRAGKHPNSKYKGGTYKGLDLTFGNPNQYGGILIRAIQSITDQRVIDGPSKVVDEILRLTGVNRIEELVKNISLDVTVEDSLYLKTASSLSHLSICKGPRVGLSLKGNTEGQVSMIMTNLGKDSTPKILRIWHGKEPYIFRSYRYGVFDLLKKEKWGFILANSERRKGSKYEADYLTGSKIESIDDHKLMATISDKCLCYGYLTNKYSKLG